MSHPINELKRRLEDDSTPLPKRLRLAKNVVFSHHFPTSPKERVIGEWLEALTGSNKVTSKDLKDVLSWLNNVDDFTVELKYKLIKIVSQYLHNTIIQDDDIQFITAFIENSKLAAQLSIQINDYLSITMTLLQHLATETTNILLINKLLDNIIRYYKECKKKFEFIIKFIEEENLETIFFFLNTESKEKVIDVCQNILFPINKRTFYARYLNNLIRKDDLTHLLQANNDNIESVIKIINVFINSKGNQQFLCDFTKIFVCCFKTESQLLFAFYIVAVNCLNVKQGYIKTATKFKPILFEGNDVKIKRNVFLNMLEVLLENDVDVNVHLRDTLNEQSKETKKTFLLFLQDVILGTIKERKPDKATLNIIKIALKLDPTLVDKAMFQILPQIMVAKKSSSLQDTYVETMNILLQTLFKLSKGINFIHNILPHLKTHLENVDEDQENLKEKLNESIMSNADGDKFKSKIVTSLDIFPENCLELYGKLTSELMFRQNKDLLILLEKDLEECLSSLEENPSPSVLTLTEFLAAILSTVMRHNKMADHTVPLPISEDYWASYHNFETHCLTKFAKCLLKLDSNNLLLKSFLHICVSLAQLKILNIKYSNVKLEFQQNQNGEVFDLTLLLPCLNAEQWQEIASKVDDENAPLFNNLLLIKTMAINLTTSNDKEILTDTKTHLIKQLSVGCKTFDSYYFKALFANLDKNQYKQVAKSLVKMYAVDLDASIFLCDSVVKNKDLLTALTFEVLKNVAKNFENASSLSKGLGKDCDIETFLKDVDVKEYFYNLTAENSDEITKYLEVLKNLQIYYLDENCQLTTIFILLTCKKGCNSKKIKRTIDNIQQSIFELTPKTPDIFKIFPVPYLFDFDNGVLKLFKLHAKSANHVLVVKNILEFATRQVKKDPEVIKTLVKQLLKYYKKKEIRSIDDFSEEVFQIICIVLPLISKERKNSATSVPKSILTGLQEDLNQAMLDSFKSVDFGKDILNTSNADASVISENSMAILNAMGAYTLILTKSCESNDGKDLKSMDCLWSGLEFFVQNALHFVESPETKNLHVGTSINLLTIVLRYIKKLELHDIFKDKDKLFLQIWRAVKARLFMAFDHRQKKNDSCLDELTATLKYLSELSSVEVFANHFVPDLNTLTILKKPTILLKNEEITSTQIISRRVLKYLCLNILHSYITEAKCVAFSKLILRSTKNLRFWIQQHYEGEVHYGNEVHVVKIEDSICELLKFDLDVLSEVILTAKKINLEYKFIDAIFELQQLIFYLLGRNSIDTKCEISWRSFFVLFEGCVAILNSMILSRDELLEDRWPCLMQCYKTLVLCMCERSTSDFDIDRNTEHKLAEIAHSIEKLTQSISKRKSHVSRIAAYAVADFCSCLEKSPPPKIIRQHLENSIVLLIQASDSNYAMSFLRRGLAGASGQMTLTNMYSMYKRYHKYVGNA
ncbi:uncharacterized protein LOC110997770 [Pieris rapae]|uniref:uncharacterized protein LOC110997770 n=1 Tax=Pieris rapae TaxID=64459 RepID=UPI001E27C741|nr:uncharacterized protein LOC110997770 [Pieris rapae]